MCLWAHTMTQTHTCTRVHSWLTEGWSQSFPVELWEIRSAPPWPCSLHCFIWSRYRGHRWHRHTHTHTHTHTYTHTHLRHARVYSASVSYVRACAQNRGICQWLSKPFSLFIHFDYKSCSPNSPISARANMRSAHTRTHRLTQILSFSAAISETWVNICMDYWPLCLSAAPYWQTKTLLPAYWARKKVFRRAHIVTHSQAGFTKDTQTFIQHATKGTHLQAETHHGMIAGAEVLAEAARSLRQVPAHSFWKLL